MNQAILLESNADNIDFMIHGIFSIKVFGQEVWITTSHACILIVMAIMVIFAIVANRKLKKAKEVPDGFQNIIELIVEMLDKMVDILNFLFLLYQLVQEHTFCHLAFYIFYVLQLLFLYFSLYIAPSFLNIFVNVFKINFISNLVHLVFRYSISIFNLS